ncbi:MAG: hypothetical protein XD60_0351 [Acetothermia bacterium 64_32]|nr:MAG: hypothetical protein XD60_0351 [Acetothermia bacterium 64_32]HAF71522.1 hypothetical protein [Candidatus Acetothermia bacterium]
MRYAALVVCILIGIGAAGVAQHQYAFYYDLSGGQDLVINMMNTMEESSAYLIEVYDAWGNLLWQKTGELGAYEAEFYRLGEFVAAEEMNWGVVTLASEQELVFGLEYLAGGELASIDNISREVPEVESGVPYWLGAYYTQAEGLSTGVIIMNPHAEATSVNVSLRNPNGALLYSQDIDLGPHESEYLDLDKLVGQGGLIWGLVDVQMQEKAVVVAVEYYGERLEVDNITEYYF